VSFHQVLLLLAILCAFPRTRADDESSFSTAPDASWQRVEPFKDVGFDLAGFHFGNQDCRITCAVPPPELIGLIGATAAAPRASLIAPTEYTDALASVDVVSWQPPQGELFDGSFPGVFTRIQPVTGLGKTSGFVLAIQPLQSGLGRIRIYVSTNESLDLLAQSDIFVLNTNRTYRLVLASRGNNHVGRIFDLSSPGFPLATISATLTPLFPAQGRCGFGVVMPHPLPADVTFDNFLAWDGSPPPLSIREGSVAGTIELLSDIRRSMGGVLQTTTDPSDPDSWLPAVPLSATASGNNLVQVFQLTGPRAFFRGSSL
jgi:hypothetical protein